MDVEAAARAWVEAWEHGWATGDADAIGARYAAEAAFLSHPFREPERSAREYARRAFSDEELAEVRFSDPVVTGDRAAIEYWAVLAAGGDEETLAGVTMLRFGADGLVTEHRDYWAMQPGRTPPNF